MKRYCNYCKQDIEVKNTSSFGGHRSRCLYNPINIAKRQRREYSFNCKKCSNIYKLSLTKNEFEKGDHRKCCSDKCSKSHIFTEEVRKKMRKKHLGRASWNKGLTKETDGRVRKGSEKILGINNPFWKGGSRAYYYKIARRVVKESGKDTIHCQICKDKTKTIIHHCDGDITNNFIGNLGVVCSFCHNAIHDIPNKIENRFQLNHSRNFHIPLITN